MSERIINIGSHKSTQVVAIDEPSLDNAANHVYDIRSAPKTSDQKAGTFVQIQFQDSPIKEFGVNGIMNEDLLAIVIDRLQGFQSGNFACRENTLALTRLEEAMHWLNHRTQLRQNRGVEGTNIK